MNVVVSGDDDAGFVWLNEALEQAFTQRKPKLWAYLEAVMDEVLFELELESRP